MGKRGMKPGDPRAVVAGRKGGEKNKENPNAHNFATDKELAARAGAKGGKISRKKIKKETPNV